MGVNGKWSVRLTNPFLEEVTMRKPELENAPQAADQQDESDDVWRRLTCEAPVQQQCEIIQSMWRDRWLIRVTDVKSGEVSYGRRSGGLFSSTKQSRRAGCVGCAGVT